MVSGDEHQGDVGGQSVTVRRAGSVVGMSTTNRRPLTTRTATDDEHQAAVVGARRLPIEQQWAGPPAARIDDEHQAVVESGRSGRRTLGTGPEPTRAHDQGDA